MILVVSTLMPPFFKYERERKRERLTVVMWFKLQGHIANRHDQVPCLMAVGVLKPLVAHAYNCILFYIKTEVIPKTTGRAATLKKVIMIKS